MELKTLELKTIDYQIEEVDDNNFSVDNNSDQFKVDNVYFKQVNQNETLTMNDKFIKNFGVPMHTTQTMQIQLTQTLGENTEQNTSQM